MSTMEVILKFNKFTHMRPDAHKTILVAYRMNGKTFAQSIVLENSDQEFVREDNLWWAYFNLNVVEDV